MVCYQCVPCKEGCICRCHWYDMEPYFSVTTAMLENSWCTCGHNMMYHTINTASENTNIVNGCSVCGCFGFVKKKDLPSRNPVFSKLMREFEEIHNSKSADYAEDDNVYSNFEFAAKYAGVTVEQVFMVLLGVKVARMKELQKGKTPNNESLLDTYKDHAIYAAIMTAYVISHPKEGTNE